jgi:hypothetical protein
VDDDSSRGAILVDRRILIAVQWFSNTIMVFSLIGSLLSRKFRLVRTIPADFHFFGSPIKISYNDMRYESNTFKLESADILLLKPNLAQFLLRFWTAEECGFAAVIVFGFYFVLGRLSERNVSRTYCREMRDNIRERAPKDYGVVRKALWRISHWTQRLYDNACPWMIQRRIFVPRWNRRSAQEILDNISYQRSIDFREHR